MSIEIPTPIKRKTSVEKSSSEKLKKRRIAVEQAKWEQRLSKEGMPAELPPGVLDILDEADNAASAVRAYAAERSVAGMMELTSGEHEKFARAVANKFGISVEAAREFVQDAFNQGDRYFG